MNRIHWMFGSVAITLVLLASAVHGGDEKPAQPPKGSPLAGLMERFGTLLPKETEEKLELTEEQKKQVAKLQRQLDDKNKRMLAQLLGDAAGAQDALDKARKDGDAEDLKDLGLAVASRTLEMLRYHREMERKLRALLTDEQRQIYDDLKKVKVRPNRRLPPNQPE